MELNEAFVRAIRSYYKGDGLKEINKIVAEDSTERTGVTYTPEYFDEMVETVKNGSLDKEGVDDGPIDEFTNTGS